MITLVYGELFYSPARVLVNPVNVTGAMKAGLAADFRWFFPAMFEAYRERCQTDRFRIGQLMLYKTPHRWILNLPVKRHWRASATLETIEQGLTLFERVYADYGMTSVSFPLLGTEQDGLAAAEVLSLMVACLDPLPIPVYVHQMPQTDDSTNASRNRRVLRHWLNGQPVRVSFARFQNDMLACVRERDRFHTLDDGHEFRVTATEASGRQRFSVKMSPRRGESVFLPETQLRDVWQHVRRSGYVLPQTLPSGLDAHAPFLVALLSELPYVQSVQLAAPGSDPVTGLHLIPPVRQDAAHVPDVHLDSTP
jgi:O-acetyl-ADP-ribose deacetylase (regulator of RNase III)